MPLLRTTVLATALIGSGLLSTSGLALADTSDGDTVQKGLGNSSDFAPNTPFNGCNNDVPLNGAGGQLPIQDVVGVLGFQSEAGHGDKAGISKSCSNGVHADN